MKKYLLAITVFLCGAIVMIIELAASRVLAPVVGSSTYVWTSIIGIILSSLSLGYWWGGRLSDKKPEVKTLAFIIFLASLATCIVSFVNPFVLVILSSLKINIILTTVISTTLLFAPSSILLGMVSPYAARLSLVDIDTSGKTMGRLYALSTVGSITGTFLAGFLLIPLLGSQKIVTLCSLILFIISIMVFPKDFIRGISLSILIISALVIDLRGLDFLVDLDSHYNRIQISQTTDKTNGKEKVSMLLNGHPQSAVYLPEKTNAFSSIEFLNVYKLFKPQVNSALMLGGGGYVLPTKYINENKNATIDVVEIDPQVTQMAKNYFGLKEDPRLTIFHDDARIYLNNNTKKYDVIFGNVFNGKYVLWHMTTKETIQKMSDSLKDDGICVVNIIASIDGPMNKFLLSEYKTFKSIFPQVYLFPATDNYNGKTTSNIILVAFKSSTVPSLETNDPLMKKIVDNQWKQEIKTDLPILTDDYAPVEYYCF